MVHGDERWPKEVTSKTYFRWPTEVTSNTYFRGVHQCDMSTRRARYSVPLTVLTFLPSVQILTRRLRFQLERASGETRLIDRSGRMLKMEPLTTVGSLERHLLKMVGHRVTTARKCASLPCGHLDLGLAVHCTKWRIQGQFSWLVFASVERQGLAKKFNT